MKRAALFAGAVLAAGCLAEANPAAAEAGRVPAPSKDTLTPAYDWASLPYRWDEIRGGAMPVTPVHWVRHPGNPVVRPGMNSRPVWWDDATIRVFFGRRGRGQGIFYFDVDPAAPQALRDGVHGPVVTTGPGGSFDDDWLIAPEPVRLSASSLRLYYAAKKSGGSFFKQLWSLGLAESDDNGKTWTKHPGGPVLTVGSNEWECGAVGFCSVEKAESGWRMWYLGTDEHAIKQVGYAISADGLRWERYAGNPVIAVRPDFRWEAGAIAVPRVIRDGRLLKVWYCCYERNNTYAIGCAESVDGIRWFRSPHNPVVLGSGKGWDSQMTGYPGVIRAGDAYFMWYSGNSYGNEGVGLATAAAPAGRWMVRTGPGPEPGEGWTPWAPLPEPEPARAGYIQFAVLAD